MDSSVEYIS